MSKLSSITQTRGFASDTRLVTYEYVATAGQTVFTGADLNSLALNYVPGLVAVSLNGVILRPGDDYTANNGSSIILASAAALDDEVTILSFAAFYVAGIYTNAQVDSLLIAKANITALPFVGDVGRLNVLYTANVTGLGSIALLNTLYTANISNIGTIATQNSSNVSITGGSVTSNIISTSATISNATISNATLSSVGLANVLFSGSLIERANVSASGVGANVTVPYTGGGVVYFTANSSSNTTINFTGLSGVTSGNVASFVVILTNNTSPRYVTTLQVDGDGTSNITSRWSGGAPTSGTANIDVYSFNVIKTSASAYTVLGQVSNYR
jgi:uncharacterized protein YjbI with pentapeptide repeats